MAKAGTNKNGGAKAKPPGVGELEKVTGVVDYKVNRESLEHDGEQFGLGDFIQIEDRKQRKALLDIKAILPTGYALLVGGVTPEGKVIELGEMELDELQKLGADLGINRAEILNKESLIEAISAVELELIDAEQIDDEATE